MMRGVPILTGSKYGSVSARRPRALWGRGRTGIAAGWHLPSCSPSVPRAWGEGSNPFVSNPPLAVAV